MMSVRSVLGLSSFLALTVGSVRAQQNITFPKCIQPSFNWTFNEEGFSPCKVAANLEASCIGTTFGIPPLKDPSIMTYGGPKTPADSNPCICSSVTYSLVAACALCQGGQFNSWDIWITNCSSSDISIGSYKFSLPAGVGVPAWAYLNLTTTGDRFDSAAASAIAAGPTHHPDSTVANTPTGTSGGSGNTGSQGGSKKSSNAGAIAGGVVGGVVGLALIVTACLWFLRRRRRLHDPGQFSNEKLDMAAEPPSAGLSQSFSGYAPTISSQPPLKLYDPNDPSTFPGTPLSSNYQSPTPAPPSIVSYGMTSHDHSTSQFSGGTHTRGPSDGTYKGMPEV